MEFNTPIKKNNIYISIPKKKKIKKNLIDVDIIKINQINDNKIELLIKIKNKDLEQYFNDFEIQTLDVIQNNNSLWFKNSLEHTNILKLYDPAYDIQTNILKIYIYKSYLPEILYNGIQHDSIFDIDFTNINVNIDIRFIGIYIHTNKFFNSWMLTSIICFDDEPEIFDKKLIYDSWETELYNKDIIIQKKIDDLYNLKNNMWDIFHQSKKSIEWKNDLDNLRTLFINFFI